MGGKSTLHSADLSDDKTDSSSAFDVRSWQGLTELLRAGKQSLTDTDEYAEFRNLVLSYAQRGGDFELKKKIDEIIATFSQQEKEGEEKKLVIDSVDKISNKRNTASFLSNSVGTRRGQPRFRTPVPSNSVHETVKEEASVHSHSHEDQHEATVQKVPEPVRIKVESIPQKEDVVERVAPETSPTQGIKSNEEYRERIMEIKRSTTSHFGNPAALMNVPGGHGRAYMSALVKALKATSPGNNGDAYSAMQELERTVRALLENTDEAHSKSPLTIQDTVSNSPQVSEAVVEAKSELPVSMIEERIETATPIITEPTLETDKPKQQEISSVTEEEKISPHESTPQPYFKVPRKPAESKHDDRWSKDDDETPVKLERAHGSHAPVPVASSSPHKALQDENESIDNKGIATKQSELADPEITGALHQLLDEWSIFSGSGLFGIGPGGFEHPLYLSLAPLSMGEVVAGRWEKSNPKLLKIIKEYIDAWRHEQGVAYNINETFEHYLRRVVQRILKRKGI